MSSEWTVETLKAYIEAKLEANKIAVDAAFDATEKALNKASIASEKRFESINEFRGQLSDQASTFLQRGEYKAEFKSLEIRVDSLGRTQNMMVGALVIMSFFWSLIVAFIVHSWK